MLPPARISALILGLVACQPSFTSSTTEDVDNEAANDSPTDTGEVDWSDWEGAELIVHAPESGALVWLDEDTDFEAEIVNTNGETLDWDEISWSSSIDEDWEEQGTEFENDELIAGQHDLRVETTLPTGDHLVWMVGGIRVQHEFAGTYVGNMIVDSTSEYDGTELTTSCIGAAILVVDAQGEGATGDSNCLISLLGYDLDAAYDFSLEIDGEDLNGTAALDLTWSTVDFEANGSIDDGEMTATWSDTIYDTIEMEGSLELERISSEIP